MPTAALSVRIASVCAVLLVFASCSESTKPDTTPAEILLTSIDTLRSLGETANLDVAVRNSKHEPLADVPLEFQSVNPSVATVSTAGDVTAVANGESSISVTVGALTATTPIVVRQRIDLTKTTVTLSRPLVFVDDTVRVTLQARDALGNLLAFGGSTVVFSSESGSVLSFAFRPTVDHGNGEYTADIVGREIGTTRTVSATIDGAAVPATSNIRVVGFTRIGVAGSTNYSSGATDGFSCGIITTGEMSCWGVSIFGIRGNATPGNDSPNPTPTRVSGAQQWIDAEASTWFVCGLASAGAAYCWGDNDVGQLGNGSPDLSVNATLPNPVYGLYSFGSISLGSNGACGVTRTNNAMCWGAGTLGRLGNGSEAVSVVPAAVSGGLSFAAVATSFSGTCGITTAGAAYCWGAGNVLGTSPPDTCTPNVACAKTPVAVSGGHVFRPILARDGNVACAVATDDQTYCWGGTGYLGNGTFSATTSPVVVNGGLAFTSLTAADQAFCGLTSAGAAYCWGDGRNGRFGNNSTSTALEPMPSGLGHNYTHLSMSQDHACGVSTDGNAYCWGGNDKGELGTRSVVPSLVPVRVRLFVP